MLAGIMGNAEMLQYKLSENESLLHYVFNIIRASEHAARLTSQLLSFARKGQYQKIPLSVHRVISEVVSMLENTIDKKIIIEQKLTANPHVILGDPTQIQSVILNLMLNARDALIDGSGKIIISTEIANINKELSEKYRKGISPWQFILISVSDNGIGMTEEVKRHLFEPFFTTKEVGKGTGLGLASIYGVVKNHNGIIDVDSQEGSGTTMKIYIPISLIEPEEMDEDIYPLETFNGMGMTILVIDDEELILKTIEEILLKFGFNVILAKSGRDGIEIYKENYN
ncbi:MAG: hybrid sensor histidine kinase/response regulator, partial [bacterium (Candidatus Stahlbacteria) CG23_combo_of_CG06-09_8_20_14_all_34_7]